MTQTGRRHQLHQVGQRACGRESHYVVAMVLRQITTSLRRCTVDRQLQALHRHQHQNFQCYYLHQGDQIQLVVKQRYYFHHQIHLLLLQYQEIDRNQHHLLIHQQDMVQVVLLIPLHHHQ